MSHFLQSKEFIVRYTEIKHYDAHVVRSPEVKVFKNSSQVEVFVNSIIENKAISHIFVDEVITKKSTKIHKMAGKILIK